MKRAVFLIINVVSSFSFANQIEFRDYSKNLDGPGANQFVVPSATAPSPTDPSCECVVKTANSSDLIPNIPTAWNPTNAEGLPVQNENQF